MRGLYDFVGRVLREDAPGDPGRPAEALARNLIHEWKGLHDLYCDWIPVIC